MSLNKFLMEHQVKGNSSVWQINSSKLLFVNTQMCQFLYYSRNTGTAPNAETSPDFLMSKFCGNPQFPQNSGLFAFLQNLRHFYCARL